MLCTICSRTSHVAASCPNRDKGEIRREIVETLEWLSRQLRIGRMVTINAELADYLADLVRSVPELPPYAARGQ